MTNVWCATSLAIFLGTACGGSETTATTSTSSEETRDQQIEAPDEHATTAPTAEGDVLEGRIVDRGPLGHGSCIQQSYEIEQAAGERLWIHFERCGNHEPPLFDALETGKRYRFTVERGASPNFGDDPMIVGAELLAD